MEENERGPRDYAPEMEELARLAKRGAREAPVVLSIRESPDNSGGSSWKDWVLIGVGCLLVAGIAATISQLSDLKADVKASLKAQELDEQRISNLEKHVYRGSE
jgi:hypothetical protein